MQEMTAVNVIRIKKGHGPEVAQRFANPKKVHTFDGFLRMEVWMKENVEDHDELHICTTWADEKYFTLWRGERAEDKAHGEESKVDSADSARENPILGTELSTFITMARHLPVEKGD